MGNYLLTLIPNRTAEAVMKFQEFIGIDVSKSHIDVFLYRQGVHAKFSNNEAGFKKMIAWIEQHIGCDAKEVLFAFEHTGLYSLPLSLFLHEIGPPKRTTQVHPASGLGIKEIYGHIQGKNRIAEAMISKMLKGSRNMLMRKEKKSSFTRCLVKPS